MFATTMGATVALVGTLLAAGPGPEADSKRRVKLASGVTLAYRVAGPKSAPPVVLLHGLGDTSRSWSLMVPELAKNHRLYMLDQRGHGDSEAPACCYALADLAFDAVAFMDALKIESAHVVGHSLGSFAAQALTIAYPSRVERLVLIASADTTFDVEVIDWLWGQVASFEGSVTPAFVEEWQSNPTPVRPDFIARVKSETAAVPLHVWRSVARTLLSEDHRRFLGQVRHPTLILAGGLDPMFPGPRQERLRQLLPQAAFRTYPEVGHNAHWELPERVAADIDAFLRPEAPNP